MIDTKAQRLKPPAHLSADAKTLFAEIVQSAAPQHFRPCERPLLLAYVRALLIERYFGNQITGDKTDIGFNQWREAVKICATLATKLRLCPHARYDARASQRMQPTGTSPWEFDGESA